MATEAAEPAIENPVIKPDFDSARTVFKQQRVELGLDAPTEPAEVVESQPPPISKEPASDLPEDIFAPAGKAEPKKSETIAELEAMTLPKNAKPEKIVAFEGIKKKAIADLTAAESKIKELEERASKSASHVEIESLQKKIAEAEKRATEIEDQFARVAFEHSPKFQAQFINSEKAAIESAKSYLEGSEIDPRIIDYASHTSGKARLEVLSNSGMDEKMIAAVTSHLAEYDRIQRDKSSAIENWRTEGARWQEQEAQRIEGEQQKRVEQENKIWEATVSKNSDLLPFKASKDESWNERASQLKERAKAIFNGNGADLPTMAETIQKGVAYDALSEIVSKLVDKNKLLSEENSKLRSSAPGGTITQGNGELKTIDPSKVDRTELSKSTFNAEMQKARG